MGWGWGLGWGMATDRVGRVTRARVAESSS